MIATNFNPFRPTRWEHQRDGNQLIWFTGTAANLLTGDKSSYVSGSRGSGKTTLLKSICWEDLARNTSLRMQRRLSDFDHIGVYIRFPDHVSASFSKIAWSRAYPNALDPEFEFHRFFSLVVELTCAEKALIACHDLRVLGQVRFAATQEIQMIEALFEEFSLLNRFSNSPPRTFTDAARLLRTTVRRMNEASGRGLLHELELPAREPGELLGFLSSKIASAVRLIAP